MKQRLLKLLTVVVLISGEYGNAQTTGHFGTFTAINHTGTLSNKWDYSLYYYGAFNLLNSPRVNNVSTSPDLFILYSEQALTYNVNKKLSSTISYLYQGQTPFEKSYVNENRIYLQAVYKTMHNRTTFRSRVRYDARFIENNITGKRPYTSRIRYLFGFQTPLKKGNDSIYFTAYEEMFFNTYKNETVIYGENWSYAGVGYKTPHMGTWELGALYIFWVLNHQYNLTNLCYLQLTWTTHLDLRKTKTE